MNTETKEIIENIFREAHDLALRELGDSVESPHDAIPLIMVEIGCKDQENFMVINLNTRNVVTSSTVLYKGNLNTTIIRTAEVFRQAIINNDASIIIAHNHPSSDTNPSPEDISITKILVDAGKLLNIEVLDHIIVSNGSWYSLKAKGYL